MRPAAMRFIMLTVLIDMVSIGLIIPVLPLIVGSFTADKTEQTWWYIAITFVFGLANFIGSPILGALSDRFGRRPVLLLGFCGLGFSFFGTAMATQLWVLLAVRVVSGATQANAAVANAYVADITAPEERTRRFGLLGAMFGLGFILGPATGGILGDIDIHLPFYAAGVLAMLNLVYGYFVLPESLDAAHRKPFSWARANPLASLRQLGQLKGIGGLVAVVGLAQLAQFTLHGVWVLHATFRFGWTPRQTGWSLFAVGVAAVVVQGFLLKRLLARMGAPRLATWGLLSGTLAYLLWGLATEGWMMYAVIAFNLLGATVATVISGLISNAADARSQGQTMGAVASLSSLAAALAPITGTPFLALVSHLPASDWRVGAPFFFCASLMLVAALLARSHFKRQTREGHALAARPVRPVN
jgi:MFS transporter, DHA1 family, tetracycline resistance protein